MKRGRPKNEIGAIRETENGRKAWNGKRWVSEAHFKTISPIAEPAPKPKEEQQTGYKESPPKTSQQLEPDPIEPEPSPEIASEELDDIFSGFSDIIETPESEESESPESEESEAQGNSVKIKGKHLVFIIDLLGSFLAAYIVKKSGISKQDRKDFKLTSEEREELEEVAAEAAETLSIDLGNPWAALGMSYFALIAFKLER